MKYYMLLLYINNKIKFINIYWIHDLNHYIEFNDFLIDGKGFHIITWEQKDISITKKKMKLNYIFFILKQKILLNLKSIYLG